MTRARPETGWIKQPPFEPLSVNQRITMLETAVERAPSTAARIDLGHLYQSVARVEDAAAILEQKTGDAGLEYRRRMMLANIRLLQEDPADALTVLQAITAEELASNELSSLQSLSGKVFMRLRDVAAARDSLLQALATNPANSLAFSRIGDLEIAEDNAQALLSLASEARYSEAPSSGLLSARQRALLALGRVQEALELSGSADGVDRSELAYPEAWQSTADFNDSLVDELSSHPDAYHPISTGREIERLRSNGLSLPGKPACAALSETIIAHVEEFAAGLDGTRMWMSGIPSTARIKFWSMKTRMGGHDSWHYHTDGWLSGVYYVKSASVEDTSEGSIGFAPAKDDNWLQHQIAPSPGEIILFPSQLFHRTFPTTSSEWRISVAFDILVT